MTFPGENDLELRIRDWERKAKELDEMQSQVAEVRGTGHGLNGLLTVEVGPGGAVLSAHLDPRAMRAASQSIAEAFVEAAQAAAADAAKKVADVLEPVLQGAVDVETTLASDGSFKLPDSVQKSLDESMTQLRDLESYLRRQ